MASRDRRDRDRDDDDDDTPRHRNRSRDDDDDDDRPSRRSSSSRSSRDDDDGESASLELEDAEDVGLFGDGRAVVKESIFAPYDYGGSRKPVSVWLLTFERDGDTYEQPYGIGKGWKIIRDGEGIKGAGKGLPKSCNAVEFLLKPLRKAGMERGVFKGNPRILEGLDCVVTRVEQPKRPGLNQSEKDRTILTITKIADAPWDGGGKRGGKTRRDRDDEDEADEKPRRKKPADDDDDEPAPKPKRRAARDEDDDDDDDAPKGKRGKSRGKPVDDDDEADGDGVDEEAVETLIELLDTNKGKLAVDDLEDKALAFLKGNKQAKAIAARLGEDEFLDLEKGWTFNAKKGLITLA